MKIDEHIKNLEKYCEDDDLFEKDGDFKEFCDNHIADIKAVIQEIKSEKGTIRALKVALEERTNERDAKSDIIAKQNKVIYEMASYLSGLDIDEDICSKLNKKCDQMAYGECEDCIIKYFEKRCNNAKD